ncbi:MAG: MarR family winged helix-turn-helix transcriptional regulator [Bacillota bacterium]
MDQKDRQAEDCVSQLDRFFTLLLPRIQVGRSDVVEEGITGTQYYFLRNLDVKGPCRASDLATILGVTPAAITSLADNLSRMGLISRQRSQEDRRAVIMDLSEEGSNVVHRADEQRRQKLCRVREEMSKEDVDTFLSLLEKVINVLGDD